MCEISYPLVTFAPHRPNFRVKDGIPVCLLLRHLHTFGMGHHKCKQTVHGYRCRESEDFAVGGYTTKWAMGTRKLCCALQESKPYCPGIPGSLFVCRQEHSYAVRSLLLPCRMSSSWDVTVGLFCLLQLLVTANVFLLR
jgi:hypothetical protein